MLAVILFATAMNCPMHEQHMMEARHDTFGFSHEATTHTFQSLEDGGAIELRANDTSDTKSIGAIRKHLKSIAKAFAKNDFSKPQFVHEKMPDGVDTMQRLHDAISYRYEELPEGARVKISTTNAEALDAIHTFIRFQTEEHHAE
jgi:hypothetical protein